MKHLKSESCDYVEVELEIPKMSKILIKMIKSCIDEK